MKEEREKEKEKEDEEEKEKEKQKAGFFHYVHQEDQEKIKNEVRDKTAKKKPGR